MYRFFNNLDFRRSRHIQGTFLAFFLSLKNQPKNDINHRDYFFSCSVYHRDYKLLALLMDGRIF
tara:strand:- start:463 stop:654 length:192 start_codon:yes stop_codon:yes gene_type:complete